MILPACGGTAPRFILIICILIELYRRDYAFPFIILHCHSPNCKRFCPESQKWQELRWPRFPFWRRRPPTSLTLNISPQLGLSPPQHNNKHRIEIGDAQHSPRDVGFVACSEVFLRLDFSLVLAYPLLNSLLTCHEQDRPVTFFYVLLSLSPKNTLLDKIDKAHPTHCNTALRLRLSTCSRHSGNPHYIQFIFIFIFDYVTQLSTVKMPPQPREPPTLCKKCKLEFPTWEDFHKHKLSSSQHITCQFCSRDFGTRQACARHTLQVRFP